MFHMWTKKEVPVSPTATGKDGKRKAQGLREQQGIRFYLRVRTRQQSFGPGLAAVTQSQRPLGRKRSPNGNRQIIFYLFRPASILVFLLFLSPYFFLSLVGGSAFYCSTRELKTLARVDRPQATGRRVARATSPAPRKPFAGPIWPHQPSSAALAKKKIE